MTENRTNFFCNLERSQELNDRIFERNVPIDFYYPVFETSPQSTKYQKFPTNNPIINGCSIYLSSGKTIWKR